MIVVAIWKEAGFFMIFYLAALQAISPTLARGRGARRRVALDFFRRVQFPLLMPTTLFVLVNAVINAFRMVDHIFVMTRGGPDNATHAAAVSTSTRSASVSGTRPTRRR